MDFSQLYNTELSPEEERAFKAWLSSRSFQGKDLSKDLQDYDLRGYYKTNPQDTGHAPDTFKKPNHPTFSNESIYDGANGLTGGKWSDGAFEASTTNTIFHSPEELQNYFDKTEPDTRLKFPNLMNKLNK